MKVRHKEKGYLGESSRFNMHGIGEIIVGFDEGDMDSMYISDFEVLLPDGKWKDMKQAFKDKDIIPDNYYTMFGLPKNDADKERGYFL